MHHDWKEICCAKTVRGFHLAQLLVTILYLAANETNRRFVCGIAIDECSLKDPFLMVVTPLNRSQMVSQPNQF